MYKLWQLLRRNILPKRLYNYGINGIKYFDDRTWKEKVCDKIDDYFINKQARLRDIRCKASSYFKPFFDWSLGVKITSARQIREIEKKRGMSYVDVSDVEKLAKYKEKQRQEIHERKISKGIEQIIQDVNSGRKFTKEAREHRERVKREYGLR